MSCSRLLHSYSPAVNVGSCFHCSWSCQKEERAEALAGAWVSLLLQPVCRWARSYILIEQHTVQPAQQRGDSVFGHVSVRAWCKAASLYMWLCSTVAAAPLTRPGPPALTSSQPHELWRGPGPRLVLIEVPEAQGRSLAERQPLTRLQLQGHSLGDLSQPVAMVREMTASGLPSLAPRWGSSSVSVPGGSSCFPSSLGKSSSCLHLEGNTDTPQPGKPCSRFCWHYMERTCHVSPYIH